MPNQNVPKDLTNAQVMPSGSDSLYTSDGLAANRIVMADMDRGFTRETLAEDWSVDADGTNHVGDPHSRPGFNGAPSKYTRL